MTADRDGDNSDDESEALWTDSKGKTWIDDGRDSLPFEVRWTIGLHWDWACVF